MALSKKISFFGDAVLQSDNAVVLLGKKEATVEFYIKVSRIYGDKNTIDFRVEFQSEVAAFSKDYSLQYDINGENPIAQAYNYLKSIPEFEGALDC